MSEAVGRIAATCRRATGRDCDDNGAYGESSRPPGRTGAADGSSKLGLRLLVGQSVVQADSAYTRNPDDFRGIDDLVNVVSV